MTAAEMHAIIDARARQFHAFVDAGENLGAGVMSVVGRDINGSVTFVAAFAQGEDAAVLEAFIREVDQL